MPVISVTLIEGYDHRVRQRLAERLTDAVTATIAAPPEAVTVVIHELAPANYMRGRRRREPAPAPRPAAETCLDFLAALERRDLAAARALVAPDFTMTFPGPARFSDFDELTAWASRRYRSIAKDITRIEEAPLAGAVAVHVSGTLRGEWPDGTPFVGVRFIDRFEVAGGVIRSQEVWNDLAEVRP